MPVLVNARVLYTCAAEGGQGAVQPIADPALAFRGAKITWVGPARDLPVSEDDGLRWDAGGGMIIPGLVDAHTHLAFAGWRAGEFVQRLGGATYPEIAAAGGGIAATVAATRAATAEALETRARAFLHEMAALGVTTVEAKSGYGLDEETERRVLGVYARLADGPCRVVPTYLGAHVVPPEHRVDRERYLALICERMIPAVAREGLARFCDVFVEEGAFTPDEARRVFAAARAAGLPAKLHADQLADGGGAALAAEVGAVSADHLEHVTAAGIAALARAGTVAVTLPLAALSLQASAAPARSLIAAGVPVAVATDFNPGTAPSFHLPLAMTLACLLQRMTPAEALKGATVFAARASGVEDATGSLLPGRSADLAVIDAPDVDHWLYHFRANACMLTVHAGHVTWRAS